MSRRCLRLKAKLSGAGQGGSYLEMWKKAVERDRKTAHFNRIASQAGSDGGGGSGGNGSSREEDLEKKTQEFQKILEVSNEERDRVQRMQVVDRAEAAIAAARAILNESNGVRNDGSDGGNLRNQDGMQTASILVPQSEIQRYGVPGPDFWSWVPPQDRGVS